MVVETTRSKSYFAALARGMQPNSVRAGNQRAVLMAISTDSGLSNADIARRTGLAPQTVSSVLDDLEKAGLLKRGDARRGGGRGQPATPLYVNPEGAYALGAEIGWERLDVALVNVDGRLVDRRSVAYAYPDAGSVFAQLQTLAGELTAPLSAAARGRIIGLGLAAPSGIGDPASLLPPPPGQVERWAGLDMAQAAAAATGLNVQLVNDGSAACWAEFVSHSSPRPGNFAFILIDSFVAGGIVAEDRLWEGVTGASANLGSMMVTDRDGTPRFVHQIASVGALRARLERKGLTLADALADAPPAEALCAVSGWIEDASSALAQTILNVLAVLEFEFAAIDGALPRPIMSRLVAAVGRRIAEAPNPGRIHPPVRLGHLGRSGAAEGAAWLRLYRRFFSRELADMDIA